MKKYYLYCCKIKSQYNVESLVMCRDEAILKTQLQLPSYNKFNVSEIYKSSKHYVTDKNDNSIITKVLGW